MKEIAICSLWYRTRAVFAVRHPNHSWGDNKHYSRKFSDINASYHRRYKPVSALDDYFDMPKVMVRIAPRGYGKMKHDELDKIIHDTMEYHKETLRRLAE